MMNSGHFFPDVLTIEKQLLDNENVEHDTYNLSEKLMELTGMSMENAVELIDIINGNDVRSMRLHFGWFLKCRIDYKLIFEKNYYGNLIILLSKLFESRYCIHSCVDEEKEVIDITLIPYNNKDQALFIAIHKAYDCENLGLNILAQHAMRDLNIQKFCEKTREKFIEEMFGYGVVFCCQKVAVATSLQYNFYYN